jgi:mannan endo-1,4-beta-mannosidase
MYERFGTAQAVDTLLNAAAAGQVPLIIGEFGWRHNGQNVAWERILSRASELGIGYIAWSWLGNDAATAELDMAVDWNGPLTDWGRDVLEEAPGNVRATSTPASIFD